MHKLDYRPLQLAVIEKICSAVEQGKTDIFICAPTGTGKGLIALEAAKRLCSSNDWTSYILTSEKSLQAQYENDTLTYADHHGDAASISGVDTYSCHVNGEKFSLGVCKMLGRSNAEALSKMPCSQTCEYLQRWKAAKISPRAIFNYSYYLLQMNYVYETMQTLAPFLPRDVVVCDEAHKLPDIIEDHFACSVDAAFVDRCRSSSMLLRTTTVASGFDYEDIVKASQRVLRLSKNDTHEVHLNALEDLRDAYLTAKNKTETLVKELAKKYLNGSDISILKKKIAKLPREVKILYRLCESLKDRHCKIEDYTKNIKECGLDSMIIDDVSDQERKYHNLNDRALFENHFKKYSKVRIYMSATLQPHLLAKRFGLSEDSYAIFDVPSSWDKRRSPIVFTDTASMTYNNQAVAMNSILTEIDRILDAHPDQRGVIHTTSKAIADEIKNKCWNNNRMLTYNNTAEKLQLLDTLLESQRDAVLIGPSLTTGVDLADDRARFNIVVKISYPSMGSALWAKRYDSAYHIYVGEAASTLEQACGRTTRSSQDWSITYILDSRAKGFIQSNKSLFSSSFLSRITEKK